MTHPFRSRNLLAVVAAAALLPGCAVLSQGRDLGEEFATVLVENDSPVMVSIFATRVGRRYRLGTIPGLTTREFSLPRHYLDNTSYLRLVIDLAQGSSGACHSDAIAVDPGDRVRLKVSNVVFIPLLKDPEPLPCQSTGR